MLHGIVDLHVRGSGGVDLSYIETFDIVPPTPTSQVSQPQRPGFQQGCSLNRVSPYGKWFEMSGHLCAVEKVSGVMLMRDAKGAQRALIGMRINFVLVCEERRFVCTYLCKSASVLPTCTSKIVSATMF